MHKFLALHLLALLTIGVSCRPAAAPVSISDRPSSINNIKITKPLNEMSWVDEQGKMQQLGELRGKVVILDFWATYCVPCKEEIPHLNRLQAQYAYVGLEVIGLHAGGDYDRLEIERFRSDTPMNYRLAYPDDELLSFIFSGDSRIPQTAVFDRNGQLVRKIVGFDPLLKKELDEAVEIAVRGSTR